MKQPNTVTELLEPFEREQLIAIVSRALEHRASRSGVVTHDAAGRSRQTIWNKGLTGAA